MKDELTAELIKNAVLAENFGISSVQIITKIEKTGGQNYCKDIFKRKMYSDNFEKLAKIGHLELSAEATVVKSKYSELFSDDEVNSCFEVLCENGYYKF